MGEEFCETELRAAVLAAEDLRRAMEAACQTWVAGVAEGLAAWYEARVREVVADQYAHARAIGPRGMLALKAAFGALVAGTPGVARERLSPGRWWSHKHEPTSLPPGLTKPDAYAPDSPEFWPAVRPQLDALFGRLAPVLREHGFSPPAAVTETGAKVTASRLAVVTSHPRAAAAIAEYGRLHAQFLDITRRLVQLERRAAEARARALAFEAERRVAEERREALNLWDNAYTLTLGDGIDWDRAWKKADKCQERYDGWWKGYKEWLVESAPDPDEDSFEAFLAATGQTERYAQGVRRIWKFGLMKSVLKQLGESDWVPWIQQLVEEQIAQRPIDLEDAFGHVLEEYLEHRCETCAGYDPDGLCNRCEGCETCCECEEASPQIPRVTDPALVRELVAACGAVDPRLLAWLLSEVCPATPRDRVDDKSRGAAPDRAGRGRGMLAEAVVAILRGNGRAAVEAVETAIPLDWTNTDPCRLPYYLCRAEAHGLLGHFDPRNSLEEYSLALSHMAAGRPRAAIRAYRRAIWLDPGFPWAANNLAWLLATHTRPDVRNGSEAVGLAKAVCERSGWGCWCFADTLAAAYAEVGDFEQAADTAGKARGMAPADRVDEVDRRLRLFRTRQPFRSG